MLNKIIEFALHNRLFILLTAVLTYLSCYLLTKAISLVKGGKYIVG